MSERGHLEVWVQGAGLLAPGLPDWASASAVLRGAVPYQAAPTVLPAPELLPPAERRRASRIVKAALAAGLQACRGAGLAPAGLANVFAASGGDGHNCHQLCELLASGDRQISPTRFHNSVHNAASGYWSIATGATPAAQVLAAHDASFAAGLLEAVTQVATEGAPVLLVVADSEYPEPLHAARPIADTGAAALVLAPARSPASLARLRVARRGALQEGVPSAPGGQLPAELRALAQAMPPLRGLVLFQALAQLQQAQTAIERVAIEYLPPQVLVVEVGAP